MGVTAGLKVRRVALDTVGFIYFIEEHPDYLPLLRSLFEEADNGRREIVTSALTALNSMQNTPKLSSHQPRDSRGLLPVDT